MARTLDVYLHNHLVGHLIQNDGGQMVFDYVKRWLEDPMAIPLSQSLPLRKERFTRKECRGFFAGILPEGINRKTIAGNLGISSENDYAMLEQIGGECAGAVTFVPAGGPLPERNYGCRKLSDEDLAAILRELPRRPLMAGDKGVRLSLAGVQDKIAVYVSGENVFLPLGGAPSTHILKPPIARFKGIVFNEAVCMQLAAQAGLPAAKVEIHGVKGIDYLLVERYDRKSVPVLSPLTSITSYARRIHQEDFCQALGVPPERKYQSEGGPSLERCFDLIREVSSVPAVDLLHLLDVMIFNALIGNNDAHSKNFSLLYHEGETLATAGRVSRLAPFYDLVCTVYYPELSLKMAMKMGGESVSDKLWPRHFEKLAEETGLAKRVVGRVLELAETVRDKTSAIEIDREVAGEVIALIKKRCELFIKRFKK